MLQQYFWAQTKKREFLTGHRGLAVALVIVGSELTAHISEALLLLQKA